MSIPNIPRTVVGLQVENFKRVHAVDITPNPGDPIVTISGRNAQGKSSVLDALWAALESSAMTRSTGTGRPVRDGEKKATVRVDLGDIVITRTWTAGGTTKLEVTSSDTGASYKTPQKLLDELLGRLSFDPLAFTRMSAKDQVSTLAGMVDLGIDLDEVAAERKRIFESRTQVGRDRKALGEVPTVDAALPVEEVSATDLLAKIREAQASNDKRTAYADAIDRNNHEAETIEKQIAELQTRLTEARNAAKANFALLAETEQIDIAPLETDLANLEATNQAIRSNNAARDTARRYEGLNEDYEQLTSEIAEIDKEKSDALAAAEFPLDGLSFDDDGITYQDVPLTQASAAEQLRVSCAIAAAADPSVRVMRVTDGSLLDSTSRQVLADLAAENGFQIWMELVDESGEVGVVIEDGRVAAGEK